jgi:hypothetical protein
VRIAVAIIGLMLWFVFLIQAILVSALGDMANDDSSAQGGAVGVLVAVVWLVAVALVFAFPRVSTGLFIAAGALAWLAAGTTDYADLWVWGGITFVLAGFSYIGARQKKTKDAKERDRDEMLAKMTQAQTTMAAVMSAPLAASPATPIPIPVAPVADPIKTTIPCPSCGTARDVHQKFCKECGVAAAAV